MKMEVMHRFCLRCLCPTTGRFFLIRPRVSDNFVAYSLQLVLRALLPRFRNPVDNWPRPIGRQPLQGLDRITVHASPERDRLLSIAIIAIAIDIITTCPYHRQNAFRVDIVGTG